MPLGSSRRPGLLIKLPESAASDLAEIGIDFGIGIDIGVDRRVDLDVDSTCGPDGDSDDGIGGDPSVLRGSTHTRKCRCGLEGAAFARWLAVPFPRSRISSDSGGSRLTIVASSGCSPAAAPPKAMEPPGRQMRLIRRAGPGERKWCCFTTSPGCARPAVATVDGSACGIERDVGTVTPRYRTTSGAEHAATRQAPMIVQTTDSAGSSHRRPPWSTARPSAARIQSGSFRSFDVTGTRSAP